MEHLEVVSRGSMRRPSVVDLNDQFKPGGSDSSSIASPSSHGSGSKKRERRGSVNKRRSSVNSKRSASKAGSDSSDSESNASSSLASSNVD